MMRRVQPRRLLRMIRKAALKFACGSGAGKILMLVESFLKTSLINGKTHFFCFFLGQLKWKTIGRKQKKCLIPGDHFLLAVRRRSALKNFIKQADTTLEC